MFPVQKETKMKKVIIILSCCCLLFNCNNSDESAPELICDESYNQGDTVRVQFLGSENLDYYLNCPDEHNNLAKFSVWDLMLKEEREYWNGSFYNSRPNSDSEYQTRH